MVVHHWKVLNLPDDNLAQIPTVRETEADGPLNAVVATFRKQALNIVPFPMVDYLGGDIWMVTVAGSRYLAIAPFGA